MDPASFIQEIDNLEQNSKNIQCKLRQIADNQRKVQREIETTKKTIEEGRLKEKEQIKTIASLDQRIQTAKERLTILKAESDTFLAEKNKIKSIIKKSDEDTEQAIQMLCHQIDDLTKQVDNERAMSNPYSSQKLHDSLKEQIRKQCLKNKAASKSASSLSLDEHISELQKQKEDLIVELSQLKVDEDRNLHSSFEQGRMDIEEGSETSGEFIGNLGMENGSFANQEVEMDIEDSHESALQSDSKTEKTYDQLLDAKIILAGELEELKHKIDDLKRTECSECERRMLEE